MNQLSTLLYLAHVAGSVNTFACLSFFLCIGAIVILTLVWIMQDTVYDDKLDKYVRKEPPSSVMKHLLSGMIAAAFVATIIPGRDTVYAVAVSQVGEQMLKTKVAGKAEQALEAWLDKQIKGDEKK